MPRTKLLVTALALGLAAVAPLAQAQEFSAVVSFGDSLTDAGQYPALPPPFGFGAGSFTTNPDDVWAQILAQAFDLSLTASNAGGTDYAWGGAPTSFSVTGVPFPLSCVPATLPCRSVSQQIGQHLVANGGSADPNALYTYWAGANDLFNYLGAAGLGLINSAQAQQFTGASAFTAAGQIAALQAAGAETIVVLNLPDIGQAPAFRGTPNQGSVSGLVFVYNSTLDARIATLADGIVPINAFALFNEIIADPAAFGFTNVTGTACNLALSNGSSLFCTPAAYVSANANETYAFADGVHPSGASHRLLANVVVATLKAPGQVSMAAEAPLLVYDNQSRLINQQIFGMGNTARGDGESNVYGNLQFARQEFAEAANTGATENDVFTATVGADVRYSDAISLGAAVTFGGSQGDSAGSSVDTREVLLSAYGVAHFGRGYVNAVLSGGSSNFEIDRSIVLGPTTRIESGNTSAVHTAAQLGAGFTFGSESFRHGPFASLTWQRVDVDGYSEDSFDSTSMYFNEFERTSTVTRLGWQAEGGSDSFQPFARVAMAREADDAAVGVQAGSNTLNGTFTLDGFLPSGEWVEADLGVNFAIGDSKSVSVSYHGRLSDDAQDVNALNLGFRMEF